MPTAYGTEIVTSLSAFVASFLSGLLGIGGGVVLTPLLLYLPPALGIGVLPVKIITGLTIVQAISGSFLGAFRHRAYGNVSARLVIVMGPTAAVASLVGALISRDVHDRVLLGIFALLALAVAISIVLGFLGGMVGIGGIATIIGALVYLLRIPPRIAIGTSLGIGMFAAVAALIGKAATAQIDLPLATIVAVSALVASPIGAWLSVRTQPKLLLRILAAVVIVAAVRMAASAVFG
jgi:uncharacterized membrane protein YfcA